MSQLSPPDRALAEALGALGAEDPGGDEDEAAGAAEVAAFGDERAVVLRWPVPSEFDGVRADQYLVARVRRLSRTRAQRLIRRGDFRSSQGPLKPSSRIPSGTVVELWRIPPDDQDPEGSAPGVLLEDEHLLVLDKPPDLAVHPSARYLHRTVTHWLRHHRARDGQVAHPCHRLDRETSGVLVCAWTKKAEAEVKTAFQESGVVKTYFAVVEGLLEAPRELAWPLGLQGERGLVRIRMIHEPGGLPSTTRVAPLATDAAAGPGGRTLVACRPLTGRQHQIRAHLALAGLPLVGDKLYGMGEEWFDRFTREGVPDDGGGLAHARHALHAARTRFSVQGRVIDVTSPLPEDLRPLLGGLPDDDELVGRAAAAFGDPPPPDGGPR